MLAILNSLNAHYLPIFQPILLILVSKFIVHRALSDKIYLSLGLLSLLTEHHLEFLSLTGGCTGSSGSTLVKIHHCWESHVDAHISMTINPLSANHDCSRRQISKEIRNAIT